MYCLLIYSTKGSLFLSCFGFVLWPCAVFIRLFVGCLHLLVHQEFVAFVKRYLKVNDRLGYADHHHSSSTTSSSTTIDAKIFDAFMFEYLKLDGVFLLRIVKKNTNDIVTGELVCALWDNFKKKISKIFHEK